MQQGISEEERINGRKAEASNAQGIEILIRVLSTNGTRGEELKSMMPKIKQKLKSEFRRFRRRSEGGAGG